LSGNEVLAILVIVLVLVLGFLGDFEDENEEDAVIAEFSDRL
jgi:Tfp pilus assembly protein PilO